LTLTGSKGTIADSDIFHPAAFQANGECRLLDGKTYSMSKLQKLFLASLSQRRRDQLFPYGITEGVTLELWDFIDALSRGRPVEIDVEEGLRSKAVSEAIYESGKSGQVVKVTDVLKGKVDAYQRDVVWREKDGKAVRTAFAAHTYNEAFGRLGCHPRLIGPVMQLLGGPVYIHQYKINGKAAFAGDVWQWHQDYGTWARDDEMPEALAMNIALFLDEVTEFNGPLYADHVLPTVDARQGDGEPAS
jgi:hypothetical protein